MKECARDNGGCSQLCREAVGSFSCHCRSGYQLDRDGKTCHGETYAQYQCSNYVNGDVYVNLILFILKLMTIMKIKYYKMYVFRTLS